MRCVSQTLSSIDGSSIFFRTWSTTSDVAPKGVLHILHGMGEHSDRYGALAEALVDHGYVVIAHDHRGHGKTAINTEELGHFGDDGGWHLVVSDVFVINQYIKNQYPSLPITILGHSMGSFIALQYLQLHGVTVNRVALSGSTYNNTTINYMMNAIARLERFRQGKRGRSRLIQFLTFGAFNNTFKPTRTQFDWLSREPAEVDKYIADPLCGFVCTTQLWYDMSTAFIHLFKSKSFRKLPSHIPYYIFSGEYDPIQAPHGVERLVTKMRQSGLSNIKHRIFPNARHEIFNETNRKEVFAALLLWMEEDKHTFATESNTSKTLSSTGI